MKTGEKTAETEAALFIEDLAAAFREAKLPGWLTTFRVRRSEDPVWCHAVTDLEGIGTRYLVLTVNFDRAKFRLLGDPNAVVITLPSDQKSRSNLRRSPERLQAYVLKKLRAYRFQNT